MVERPQTIVVVSDTHRTDRPGLTGALRDAVRTADLVIHAGDFTTESVVDGFQTVSRGFLAVHGNTDTAGVTDRLPEARSLDVAGVRIAVTHTQRGGETGLSYFGAERGADLVISGHTHRSHVRDTGERILLNPGSHADPRGGEATYAVLETVDQADRDEPGALTGEIRTVDGSVREVFGVEGRSKTEGAGGQGETG